MITWNANVNISQTSQSVLKVTTALVMNFTSILLHSYAW